MMKVIVGVLNWNGEKYIAKCLTSLRKLKPVSCDLQIMVIDNASTDNSVKLITAKFPTFQLIRNATNLGYAAGNNVALQYALTQNADYVWIVNPDVEVAPDSLSHFLSAAQSYPKGGVFGSKIYFAKGYEFHSDRYTPSQLGNVLWYAGGSIDWANLIVHHRGIDEVDVGQYNRPGETEFVNGATFFIRTSVLSKTGLFDPKYFLYYEENDLCQKMKRHGWKLYYIPESIAWHAAAQATVSGSPLVDYYTTRNRLLFGMRWAPWRTKIALIRESLGQLISGRRWQKRGVIDFYLANFGKGSYAT